MDMRRHKEFLHSWDVTCKATRIKNILLPGALMFLVCLSCGSYTAAAARPARASRLGLRASGTGWGSQSVSCHCYSRSPADSHRGSIRGSSARPSASLDRTAAAHGTDTPRPPLALPLSPSPSDAHTQHTLRTLALRSLAGNRAWKLSERFAFTVTRVLLVGTLEYSDCGTLAVPCRAHTQGDRPPPPSPFHLTTTLPPHLPPSTFRARHRTRGLA
jgi:hypothetical protein